MSSTSAAAPNFIFSSTTFSTGRSGRGSINPAAAADREYPCEQYHISRITVRKALDLLMNDGLIAKRRGYGTFVQNKKVEQTLTRVQHFASEMEKRGYASSGDHALQRDHLCQPYHRRKAADQGGGRADPGGAAAVCGRHPDVYRELPPDPLPLPGGQPARFSRQSLRHFLEEKYDIVWKRAHQRIYAAGGRASEWRVISGLRRGSADLHRAGLLHRIRLAGGISSGMVSRGQLLSDR